MAATRAFTSAQVSSSSATKSTGAIWCSNAPMSIRLPDKRVKGVPRWSCSGGTAKFGSPMLMAGLPGNSACVGIGPPLSAKGPSRGSMLPSPLGSPMRFPFSSGVLCFGLGPIPAVITNQTEARQSRPVMHLRANLMSGAVPSSEFRATIEFSMVRLQHNRTEIPPPCRPEFPDIVLWVTVTSPRALMSTTGREKTR